MCRDFEIADEDADYIEFLVREHLTMSMVAQKQDIQIRRLLKTSPRKLERWSASSVFICLPSVTSERRDRKIWNAWKAQLLEDLFYSTARFLKGKGIDRDLLVSRRKMRCA